MENVTRDLPAASIIGAIWAWLCHVLEPYAPAFASTGFFPVVLALWALNMAAGTILALGGWPETLPSGEIVPRRWNGRKFRQGCFHFLLYCGVLVACQQLQKVPGGSPFAYLMIGYLMFGLFGKFCAKIGTLTGDRDLENAGEAVQDGARNSLLRFNWLRRK